MTPSSRCGCRCGFWGGAALGLLLTTVALPADDEGYDHARAGFGAWLRPPTIDELAQRDLEPGDGAIVRYVRPGSTAESLGIQVGDVVRSINDTSIQSRRDVRALMPTVAPGDEATVVVTGSDGASRTLDGAFKPRLPRRTGPLPWMTNVGTPPQWWSSPEEVISDQRQQLAEQQQQLDAASADLAMARALLDAAPSGAWICQVDIHFGEEP